MISQYYVKKYAMSLNQTLKLMKKSIIIGSGTYASVYFEYLKSEYEIVAFANKIQGATFDFNN